MTPRELDIWLEDGLNRWEDELNAGLNILKDRFRQLAFQIEREALAETFREAAGLNNDVARLQWLRRQISSWVSGGAGTDDERSSHSRGCHDEGDREAETSNENAGRIIEI